MTKDLTPPDQSFGPVSGPDMAEWCAYLNDDNAIHLCREAAEAAGFGPRRVNPGPANLAYVLSAVMAAQPRTQFAEVTAYFADNVFEDDQLTISQTRTGTSGTASLLADGRKAAVLQVTFTFKEND